MKSELQNKIYNKYQVFFEYLKHNDSNIIMPMSFGIECGDGWYTILDTLMSNMLWHKNNYDDTLIVKSKFWRFFFPTHFYKNKFNIVLDLLYKMKLSKLRNFLTPIVYELYGSLKKTKRPPMQINITQIKEKFGGLSFYYNGGDDTIHGMVHLAESLSYKTCEECGTTNNIGMTKGWCAIRCQTCYDKNDRLNDLIFVLNE